MRPLTGLRLAKFLRTAISALYVHGLISEAEYSRVVGRFVKRFPPPAAMSRRRHTPYNPNACPICKPCRCEKAK